MFLFICIALLGAAEENKNEDIKAWLWNLNQIHSMRCRYYIAQDGNKELTSCGEWMTDGYRHSAIALLSIPDNWQQLAALPMSESELTSKPFDRWSYDGSDTYYVSGAPGLPKRGLIQEGLTRGQLFARATPASAWMSHHGFRLVSALEQGDICELGDTVGLSPDRLNVHARLWTFNEESKHHWCDLILSISKEDGFLIENVWEFTTFLIGGQDPVPSELLHPLTWRPKGPNSEKLGLSLRVSVKNSEVVAGIGVPLERHFWLASTPVGSPISIATSSIRFNSVADGEYSFKGDEQTTLTDGRTGSIINEIPADKIVDERFLDFLVSVRTNERQDLDPSHEGKHETISTCASQCAYLCARLLGVEADLGGLEAEFAKMEDPPYSLLAIQKVLANIGVPGVGYEVPMSSLESLDGTLAICNSLIDGDKTKPHFFVVDSRDADVNGAWILDPPRIPVKTKLSNLTKMGANWTGRILVLGEGLPSSGKLPAKSIILLVSMGVIIALGIGFAFRKIRFRSQASLLLAVALVVNLHGCDHPTQSLLKVRPVTFDIGKVEPGAVVSRSYSIQNHGQESISIGNVLRSCRCLNESVSSTILESGRRGSALARFFSAVLTHRDNALSNDG